MPTKCKFTIEQAAVTTTMSMPTVEELLKKTSQHKLEGISFQVQAAQSWIHSCPSVHVIQVDVGGQQWQQGLAMIDLKWQALKLALCCSRHPSGGSVIWFDRCIAESVALLHWLAMILAFQVQGDKFTRVSCYKSQALCLAGKHWWYGWSAIPPYNPTSSKQLGVAMHSFTLQVDEFIDWGDNYS